MWGKVFFYFRRCSKPRITPTHVGKSADELGLEIKAKDHPHPCGEKKEIGVEESQLEGSPPPMWGKAVFQTSARVKIGITPTHVGKSRKQKQNLLFEWDHPHPCGEKHLDLPSFFCTPGSPPPMWGKAMYCALSSRTVRITPTHVGKSRRLQRRRKET